MCLCVSVCVCVCVCVYVCAYVCACNCVCVLYFVACIRVASVLVYMTGVKESLRTAGGLSPDGLHAVGDCPTRQDLDTG